MEQYDFENAGNCPNCNAEECFNSCNRCIEVLHFHVSDRAYDCQNMVYCYACSYIYKYSSEIVHLLNEYNIKLRKSKVLSLGCGPCPDLFAIDNLFPNREISYLGVDFNELWSPIHEEIQNAIFPDLNITFYYEDVISFLLSEDNLERDDCNVIIIQYLLNELINAGTIEEFEDAFIEYIGALDHKSLIIINDINHKGPRNSALRIFNKLNENHRIKSNSWRFTQPASHSYGGTIHHSDAIIYDISENVIRNFKIKEPCSSFQRIILIDNNV